MAKTFKATFSLRLYNSIITFLLRRGVKIGPMALLTVRGRKSGQLRTTPVAIIEQDGQRWLSSPYGNVNWVRNLRAAGEGVIKRGRRSERVLAIELSNQEAAPLLQRTLASAPSFLLAYYDVAPGASLAAFEREAARHPTFRLQSVSEQAGAGENAPDAKTVRS